ncbi:MAG: hypothetical protein RL549_327 [Verrucomicrobiota bacterium]|jgi:hypothetical protein
MKASSWRIAGTGAAVFAGLVFFLVGILRPGSTVSMENSGGTGKPILSEAKKSSGAIQQEWERLRVRGKEFSSLQGHEGEHRIFVSAQLVYLPESSESVQPLDRKMKTEDGIEVGWKIRYGFDPADPGVKDGDMDGDGFTNLEEYIANTDPTNKGQSPAKESKLKSRSGEAVPMSVSFSEKGGGLFTLRFLVGARRAELRGKPGDSFWIMAGQDGVQLFSDKAKAIEAQAKVKSTGQNSHLIPVRINSYVENLEKIRDSKAGGVEVEIDNSFLVLERKDALEGPSKLLFSSPSLARGLTWDVGEVRLYTPAAGGTELGPFQVGEVFPYEGKKFAVMGREGRKIQLRNLSEPSQEDFWVPVETSAPAGAGPSP